MATPEKNDTVHITFTGKLDNGEVFINKDQNSPFQAVIGNSDLPPTLENAVLKLHIGQSCKIRVPPEEGYGQRQKDLLQVIDNQEMVDKINPKPGMLLTLKVDKEGVEESVPATVMEVNGSQITVDYNHPLAGHHLTYELTLLEIVKPS